MKGKFADICPRPGGSGRCPAQAAKAGRLSAGAVDEAPNLGRRPGASPHDAQISYSYPHFIDYSQYNAIVCVHD